MSDLHAERVSDLYSKARPSGFSLIFWKSSKNPYRVLRCKVTERVGAQKERSLFLHGRISKFIYLCRGRFLAPVCRSLGEGRGAQRKVIS